MVLGRKWACEFRRSEPDGISRKLSAPLGGGCALSLPWPIPAHSSQQLFQLSSPLRPPSPPPSFVEDDFTSHSAARTKPLVYTDSKWPGSLAVPSGITRVSVCECVCMCMHTPSCPILCDPMDCSPPGSSIHGILQARILEWVAFSFSRGSSRLKGRTYISCISCLGRWVLYH